MSNVLLRSVVLTALLVVVVNADSANGQTRPGSSLAGVKSPAQTQSRVQSELQKTQSTIQQRGTQESAKVEVDRPWKLSSRIHLEKGTTRGYLVVQLDLDDGYHVYSLDPKGSPSPTRLAVLPSNDLKVVTKFASDKAPIVIEKDPVFEQRIEKHKGQVQFFASIEIRAGVDLQKLVQDVQFSGQICSDSACQPIRNQSSTAKFSGYFEAPKTRNAANDQQLK